MKRIIYIVLIVMLLFNSVYIYADDNADTGSGETNNASADRGYYLISEYMYKVSVFVGLSDDTDEFTSLSDQWHELGSNSIYVKPSTFTIPDGTVGASGSKIDYLNGEILSSIEITQFLTDDPPLIPITHGGDIEAVKSYFGDTGTLNMLIIYLFLGIKTGFN